MTLAPALALVGLVLLAEAALLALVLAALAAALADEAAQWRAPDAAGANDNAEAPRART